MKMILSMVSIVSLLALNSMSWAAASYQHPVASSYAFHDTEISAASLNTPVKERDRKEGKIVPPDSFAIAFYKPNYILPYYLTASPNNSVYQGNTPHGGRIKNSEFKYQISFKTPIWRNILQKKSTLNFAYTQQSYWQLYAVSAFFRETDYEPEVFLANEMNYTLGKVLHFDFLNIGAVHQSNGYGGILERTWNRLYIETIFSSEHAMISIKPWYVFKSSSLHQYNPHIAQYLGYGRMLIAYKLKNHVIALSMHNLIEGHARRATGELTWSFPFLVPSLKGFVQVVSGYGQSLIEYNHRTNSAGIGLALNDWI